jgi:hypothetical protein
MNNLSINRTGYTFLLFIFGILFLFGCQSTLEEKLDTNCRTQTSENCSVEEDNGDNRGYNPCLVNKNLPVCKK